MWIELALEEEKKRMEEKKRSEDLKRALGNLAAVAAAYRGTLEEHKALQDSVKMLSSIIPEVDEGKGPE